MTGIELAELLKNSLKTTGISVRNYYTSSGPLDPLQTPLDTVNDLKSIPKSLRYKGMTVLVRNLDKPNTLPEEWWLVDGIGDNNWAKKPSVLDGNLGLKYDEKTNALSLRYGEKEICDPVYISGSGSGVGIVCATTVTVGSAHTITFWFSNGSGQSITVYDGLPGNLSFSGETGQLVPVKSILAAEPLHPSDGDRYLIGNDWDGYDIYEYKIINGEMTVDIMPFDEKYGVRVYDEILKNFVYVNGKLRTYDDVDCGEF